MRTWVRRTCAPVSPYSGRVKSIRSSYTGLYPQTVIELAPVLPSFLSPGVQQQPGGMSVLQVLICEVAGCKNMTCHFDGRFLGVRSCLTKTVSTKHLFGKVVHI